jgi:hypothetical protein
MHGSLRQTEIQPSRTNDVKPADAFRTLENFICEVLDPDLCGISKRQLYRLVLALKKYCGTPSPSLGQEDIIGMDEPQSRRPRTGKKEKGGKRRRSVVDDSYIQNEIARRAKRQNFPILVRSRSGLSDFRRSYSKWLSSSIST